MNAATSGPEPPECDDERNERIYQALPAPLGGADYLRLLKDAPAVDLPASVLVRVYRQLPPGPSADATLERLLGRNDKYGYITPLYRMAERRITRSDPYGVADLVQDAIGEVIDTLAGPKGEGAEKAWISYLRQRLVDAHRKQIGRRGERRPERAENLIEPDTGEEIDALDAAGVTAGPWQGKVEGSDLEWLEQFIRRTFATIRDDRIRAVALDLLSDEPTPVSSEDPNADTWERRLGVKRFTIYRWRRSAIAILKNALERQNERLHFDYSFLEEG